jgi:hypothetical protein
MIPEPQLLDLAKGIEKRQNFNSSLQQEFLFHGLRMASATLGRDKNNQPFWSILIDDCGFSTYRIVFDDSVQLYSAETILYIVKHVLENKIQKGY